ncbi:hypothetical protein [Rhizobium binxianense]|uniref:hypothetical protein n=1 Tax=Rhizobium binxianense TaxID=3024242 RepID=UPI00235DF6BB|nr:hypothetical protein [Rhizobium sp. MJ37]MDC9836245.1 hypothetical protein [Rhizobium sp. MJ37]
MSALICGRQEQRRDAIILDLSSQMVGYLKSGMRKLDSLGRMQAGYPGTADTSGAFKPVTARFRLRLTHVGQNRCTVLAYIS